MKKILILLALPLLFNSCLKDDEDKFSKSATERIEEAVKEAITVLQSAENGWLMELYPESERIYGGYTLFLKFNADNTVVASSENFAAGKTESSYYSVVAESGPVLAFDTNNDIIHFYSSPTTGAELGIGTSNGGLEGDSDFIVMEASADFVKLKGRKTNNYAYLYPIEAGVNWKTELQSYQDAAAKMDLIYTRCVVDGVAYPIDWEMRLNNFSSRVFRISYTPAPGDDGSVSAGEVVKAPFVFTETGLKFYSPLTIGNATVSEMTFKEDYYFENEDGSVKIYSPKPVRSNNKLTINPADITFSSATVNVTPSVATDYYYFDVYEKADLEGESDMAIIKSLISEMNSLVGTYTADFIVSALGKKGAASEIFEDLSSETDHVVIGFGIVATENVVLATTDLFRKEFAEVENNPNAETITTRKVSFSNELYIDGSDFESNPPPKYHRLKPDGYVRLKGAYIIHCDRVEYNSDGTVKTVFASVVDNSRSGSDESGMKVKGVIQWVNAADCVPVKAYRFKSLLNPPENGETDFTERLNRDSRTEINGFGESLLKDAKRPDRFQFMRIGYFAADGKEGETAVFNEIVGLKDSFNAKS